MLLTDTFARQTKHSAGKYWQMHHRFFGIKKLFP